MKSLLTFTFAILFALTGLQAFSQDMSGTYIKTADTQLDNVWGDKYPQSFTLYKVSNNIYRSSKDPDGTVYEITIYSGVKTSVFTCHAFRPGKSYFGIATGVVKGNTLKGTFADNNGTMGNCKYVRQ